MQSIRSMLLLCVYLLEANTMSFATTPQLFDRLEYQGKSYSVVISLLERRFSEYGSVGFTSQSSDNHKGYEATWGIRDGVLYLDKFTGWVGRNEVTLENDWPTLTPTPTPTKADWISGEVNIVPGALTTNSIGKTVEGALSLFFVDGELIQTTKLRKFEIGSNEGGIGISLALNSGRKVVVKEVFPGSPCAEHSFVKSGVKVIAVQTQGRETSVSDSLSRAIGLIRGSVRTDVTVVFEDQEQETKSITLSRVSLTKLVKLTLD